MIHIKEKNSVNRKDIELTKMMILADKNFKITISNKLKNVEEKYKCNEERNGKYKEKKMHPPRFRNSPSVHQ